MGRRSAAGVSPLVSHRRLLLASGVAAAGIAGWRGYPPVTALQVALLLAAWLEPPPILTGPKDRQSGLPTPSGPAEAKRLSAYRFWSGIRWRLMLPGGDWLPGWPVLAAWVVAALAAAVGWLIPVNNTLWRHVDAYSAFVIVVTLCAAGRRSADPDVGPPHPGVRVNSLREIRPLVWVVAGVTGLAAGLAAFLMLPVPPAPVVVDYEVIEPDPSGVLALPDVPGATMGICALVALTVALLALGRPWRRAALSRWRLICAQAVRWDGTWRSLKFDPTPALLDVADLGPARIETFTAPPAQGAATFLPLAGKLAPAIGAGMQVRILECWDTDQGGRPVPGRPHPLHFRVVTWAADQTPDLTDATLPVPVVELFAHCQMVHVAESNSMLRPMLLSATLISELRDRDPQLGPQPGIWRAVFVAPNGPSMNTIRSHVGAEAFSSAFGVPALIEFDQVPDPGGDGIIFGAIGHPEAPLPLPDDQSTPDYAAWIDLIEMSDHWDRVWGETLKQGNSPPVPQGATRLTETLPNGTEVKLIGFVVRRGIDLALYDGKIEKSLRTAMDGAGFVSITGWFTGRRKATRHPQAFTLSWAHGPVPDRPDLLKASVASEWVLAGLLNHAFDAVRLPRPDLVRAKALTTGRSERAVWELQIRTYDGCTAADVMRRSDALRAALRTEWLRIQADDSTADTCQVFVGGSPTNPGVTLSQPNRDRLRLLALDWAQVWLDCRVKGTNGHPPTLLQSGSMPGNQAIQVLDFRLPSPVSMASVKANIAKLKTASVNEFVEARPGPLGADTIRLLTCPVDPMPTTVGYDWAFRDPDGALPVGTRVDGSTAVVDLRESPHLALFGTTGAGKSSTAQGLIYAALDTACLVAIVDVRKKGADFRFALDHLAGFATELPEAAALMEAIHAEVGRRAAVNADHGVGSARDLPHDLRPPTLVLFLDEFVGLIHAPKPSTRPEDDPQLEARRLADLAAYTAKRRIGFLAERIAAEARSADVHLILATQRLKQDVLDAAGLSDLKTNLARILLGKANPGERMTALRDPENAPTLGETVPKGRGIWESTTEPAQAVQFWYATPDDYRARLEAKVPPIDDQDRIDVRSYLPAPGSEGMPGSVVPRDEPDRDVDLGVFEFSIDDLDENPVTDAPDRREPTDSAVGTGAASHVGLPETLSSVCFPSPPEAPSPAHEFATPRSPGDLDGETGHVFELPDLNWDLPGNSESIDDGKVVPTKVLIACTGSTARDTGRKDRTVDPSTAVEAVQLPHASDDEFGDVSAGFRLPRRVLVEDDFT